MATTLTISTTLPNGNQVSSTVARALTLLAQARGGDTRGTPQQQLDSEGFFNKLRLNL